MLKFENKELLCILKEMAGNSEAGSFYKQYMLQQRIKNLMYKNILRKKSKWVSYSFSINDSTTIAVGVVFQVFFFLLFSCFLMTSNFKLGYWKEKSEKNF